MKDKYYKLMLVVTFLGIISITALVTALILGNLNESILEHYSKECGELNGTLYEINNSEYYCRLLNGSEIDLTIRSAIA